MFAGAGLQPDYGIQSYGSNMLAGTKVTRVRYWATLDSILLDGWLPQARTPQEMKVQDLG